MVTAMKRIIGAICEDILNMHFQRMIGVLEFLRNMWSSLRLSTTLEPMSHTACRHRAMNNETFFHYPEEPFLKSIGDLK